MGLWFWLLPIVGILLEGALLWRLSKRRLWLRYPFLSAFLLCTLLRDVSLAPIARYTPALFPFIFWETAFVYLVLQFLLDIEFFRCVFFRHSAVREIGLKALYLTGFGIAPVILLLAWPQLTASRGRFIFAPATEQYMDLLQLILLVVPILVARYYGISLGRNLRALALGFGITSSVNAMNFAAFQALHNFFQYWRYISSVSFLLALGIWLWGFWDYAPAPEVAEAPRGYSGLTKHSPRVADTGA